MEKSREDKREWNAHVLHRSGHARHCLCKGKRKLGCVCDLALALDEHPLGQLQQGERPRRARQRRDRATQRLGLLLHYGPHRRDLLHRLVQLFADTPTLLLRLRRRLVILHTHSARLHSPAARHEHHRVPRNHFVTACAVPISSDASTLALPSDHRARGPSQPTTT